MKYFFDRLKDERKRLGLNQDDFAAIGGVKKGAQFNYENGSRTPDSDYLAAIGKAGVDVLYLLSGERAVSSLSADETELLAGYRLLDVRSKARVLGVVDGLTSPMAPAPAPAEPRAATSGPNIAFHDKVGQQVTGDVTGTQTFNVGTKKK